MADMDASVLEVLTALLSLVSAVGVLVVSKVDRLTGRVDALEGTLHMVVSVILGRNAIRQRSFVRSGQRSIRNRQLHRRSAMISRLARLRHGNVISASVLGTPRPAERNPARVHPLTHTTCFRVWTTSTRSDESAMTVSMSL